MEMLFITLSMYLFLEIVRAIKIDSCDKSNSWFKQMEEYVKSIGGNLGYIRVNEDMTFKSSLDKFMNDEIRKRTLARERISFSRYASKADFSLTIFFLCVITFLQDILLKLLLVKKEIIKYEIKISHIYLCDIFSGLINVQITRLSSTGIPIIKIKNILWFKNSRQYK